MFYLEKFDITEEKMRLRTHLRLRFSETLAAPGQQGQLSFVWSGNGRGTYTLGSKANDAAIQRLVVDMKDELERSRNRSSTSSEPCRRPVNA